MMILLGAGAKPGTCTRCKGKKQGCQYSSGKHACRRCIGAGFENDCIPAPSNRSRSTSALPHDHQDSADVTKPRKRRSQNAQSQNQPSTIDSTPQSPDQSRHAKCQCRSRSQLRSGSNTKSLTIESPPPPQANILEAIEEDNYEYYNYSPPDPDPFFFSNLPATQASELVSAMTSVPSNMEMEVDDESQAEEYFDLNLIDNRDSDSGDSDKMEYRVRAAQTQKSQKTGFAKGKQPLIPTRAPSTKMVPQTKGSTSYNPEMCCRYQLLSQYTILTSSFLTSFRDSTCSSSGRYQFSIYNTI